MLLSKNRCFANIGVCLRTCRAFLSRMSYILITKRALHPGAHLRGALVCVSHAPLLYHYLSCYGAA